MNCLCICQCGHSRSVALARILHEKGIPAVAVGWQTSGDALSVLSYWADRIYVLQAEFAKYVPQSMKDKVVVMDVGPDRWSNPYHPDLIKLLKGMLK